VFEFGTQGNYMMPAHFGPRPKSSKTSSWYRDVTSVMVPFLTDPESLAAYLPPPFEVAAEPVVTVSYARNRDVDWLAGHGYNLLAASAAVTYHGKEEVLQGNYCLVMWENLTDPILTGRELQGIPKLYADIPDHQDVDGNWSVTASHFGHRFFDMQVGGLRATTEAEISSYLTAAEGKDNPLAWRYIPGVGGFGVGLDQPTTFPSENHITEAWVAEGGLEWQNLSWEQNPTQHHIINALAALPVKEYLPAMVTRGSSNLVLPERLPRALR
jgi:acetoacetate decarboxylase